VAFFVAGVLLCAGCQKLMVKLAVRDFGRALKKGSRRKVMKQSTRDLNKKVWRRLAPKEFSDLVERLAKAMKKGKLITKAQKEKDGKNKKKATKTRIAVKIKGGLAWLDYKKGSLHARFALKKQSGDWKVDDVRVLFSKAHVSLKHDFSMYKAARGFFEAARAGRRAGLIAHSSRDFSDAWKGLSASLVSQAAESLDLTDSETTQSSDSKRKKKTRFGFRVKKNQAFLEMRRGKGKSADRYALSMVREDGRWVVDDVLISYTALSGKKKLGSVKQLVRAAGCVRSFIGALTKRHMGRLRELSTDRSQKETWSKVEAGDFTPPKIPQTGRLEGWEMTPEGAVLVLAQKENRLTARLKKENGQYRVEDLVLNRNGKVITLRQALAIKKTLTAVLKAGLKADLDAIRVHSSKDLNRRLFNNLVPFDTLKKVLLSGGLDRLLGIKVLPLSAFAKVAFLAKVAARVRKILVGRVKILDAYTKNRIARVEARMFGRRLRARLVKENGQWKLDDVMWQVGKRFRSLKSAASFLVRK
jgi:hypothetical protein